MRSHSILLVEDDDNDVFFIKDALRRTGIQIPLDVANDGQEAIDHLVNANARLTERSQLEPGLVLLDLNLPRRSGLEVLKWIRRDPIWKMLIVVILTSSTSEADKQEAYLLGANSYIVKPTDATRLRDLVKLLTEYWFSWNEEPPATLPKGSERVLLK
jgi:DNA-binding response OmpR family regulator